MSAREALLSVLAEAASQEQARMRHAVAQLQHWETTPQFNATLQDIFYDKSIDTNIRWQAIIYLKNGIEKYWRKTAKNAIASEEKAAIRSRLLSALDEEQKPLATQNAVLIAKVARIDFPMEWPDLLSILLGIIRSSTANESDPRARLIQQRSLYTLHLVVKGLISKTLAAGRKQFQQAAPELFSNIVDTYVRYIDQLFATNTTNIESLSGCLETSHLALKCLRRVVVHGFPEFSTSDGPITFFRLALEHLQKFMGYKESIPEQCSFLITSVDSHIKLIGKFYLDLIDVHPRQFILTPGAGDVLRFYWGLLARNGGDNNATLSQTTLIQALLLIKKTLKDPQFILSDKDPEPVVVQCRHIIENEFMTSETTNRLAEILVTKYMRLTEGDLEEWDNNPEEWALEEEVDAWKYQLRPCSEKVFMVLLSSHRAQLSPLLVNLAGSTANMTDLFLKDSIYCAIGLGSHDLYNAIDFESWLKGQLAHEAQNPNPSYRIIRRRIAWMIGKWVSVNVSKPARPAVYTIMLHLLRPEEHLAVRLSAAQNLKACIDDWDFDPTGFAPFLEQSVLGLKKIMSEVEEPDTRMRVLNCMSMIVERMDEHIAPYAQQIIELLPPLWQAAADQNLLQSAILVIMTKLVESLKSQSIGLHALVMPLIRLSVDPSHEAHVYLMEDGFELWLATLRTARQSTDELMSLVPAAVILLAEGMDHLRIMLKILQSYLMLDAERTFQIAGNNLINGVAALLGEGLRSEASVSIMQFMDITALTCPLQVTGELYISSGLINKVLNIIMANKETNVVLTQYLCFIARLAVDNSGYFSNVVNNASHQFGQAHLLSSFLELWTEKFDNVSHPKHRKLHAMGLTAMIRTTDSSVLKHLPRLIGIWGDVLNEVNENGTGDSLVYWREAQDDEDDASEETAEVIRRRELLKHDPVHTTNFAQYVKASILECELINGGATAFQQQYLSKVDPLMLEGLMSLLR
ncbi:Importin-11 [Lobosporangium transversale]|uniref:Armadillo-type protein n=1 Tax=Lobosporangium transversale TaxID=64571 RepID=A0A1Y2GRW7_9FUNG|nr:armadillo-type protein [Lobosporangium transversale]KAF9916817.1 Importin-11 [Lobosporangium transversale]ORZ15983.1 armadillo-type protein [Lobosporangium transversale]|eukprot:XP_021881330.1 armadillo-type protein [Lobosporangium transversale]